MRASAVLASTMDYDVTDIAVTYDRGRDHGPEVLNLWMDAVASHLKDQRVETILDLGCGTGRFSEALAVRFDARVIGLDPSQKMLAQARSKPHDRRVHYKAGRAEAIPLPDGAVDLIFMSMTFHHFGEHAAAARECRRVLSDQGTAFLRAGVRDRISSYPYVDFFPGSRPILEDVLPTISYVREVFTAAGLRPVSHEVITQEIAPTLAAYAEKLAAGADSVLARLSSRDFEAGMKELRRQAAHREDAVYEPIDVFVFRAMKSVP
jgi:ubiquinone/menaquinone biosynthesis C-methylase UbiE